MNRTLWGALRPPLPTNAWWGNLVYEEGMQTLAPLPYLMRATNRGVVVCYPSAIAEHNFVSSHFLEDIQMEILEEVIARNLLHYDPMTVSMRWQTVLREGASGTMKAHVARGSPYATFTFNSVTPTIKSRFAFVSPLQVEQTGTKFRLELNDGQVWLIYTSAPLTLAFGDHSSPIVARSPFTGSMRIARLLNATHEAVLDAHSDVYAIGSDVQMAGLDEDSAALRFTFDTASMSGRGRGSLLTLALPHHDDFRVTGEGVALDGAYRSIKGPMKGVVGDVWDMRVEMPDIGWTSPRPIDEDKVEDIREAVHSDQFVLPVSVDVYQFARQVAGLGRVALIADEVGETQIAADVRERMKEVLEPWYVGTNVHKLLYDVDWGGLVTWQSLQDRQQDFGSAMYNDHHYQYGYLTYAAAVIAKEDKRWLDSHRQKVLELVRDYANPNRADRYYPFARHFDFYLAHSWAGGLWVFDAGRNQESSSEAVNAYYALYLLGSAMEDKQLGDWGRILMSMELAAAQKYWHIPSSSAIYPAPFSATKIVGILWSTRVDYSTWFGLNVEYIHCIQYLPFTPLTEVLLDAGWMEEDYPVVAAALGRPDPPLSDWWRGYIVMAHAIIDREAAWKEAATLESFDLGSTRANVLYWIATRPSQGAPPGTPSPALAVSAPQGPVVGLQGPVGGRQEPVGGSQVPGGGPQRPLVGSQGAVRGRGVVAGEEMAVDGCRQCSCKCDCSEVGAGEREEECRCACRCRRVEGRSDYCLAI
ncbi:unnamed protein product [Ostreobium quekettii]|uniref:glucan endo-1,3-beta-D-glucosidase n=1 Tax=Ostreobium quekettii TaxID=121088 RepID=A0A8S1J081_9CHLO|nr:unnamed protein product [Ostreobium quekettii]